MDIEDLKNTLNQLDITYPFKSLHPEIAEYKHGIFTRIDHNLGHKINTEKYEMIEIIPSIFFNKNGIMLEIKKRRKFENFTNMWKLS